MKRKFLFLLAFIILLISGLIFKYFIYTIVLDTPVKAQPSGILIDAYPPEIIVYSPINMDYPTGDIDIRYSVSDSASGVNSVWYNLDGGRNNSLAGEVSIKVSKGQHTVYVYAKDTVGLVSVKPVTFSVAK